MQKTAVGKREPAYRHLFPIKNLRSLTIKYLEVGLKKLFLTHLGSGNRMTDSSYSICGLSQSLAQQWVGIDAPLERSNYRRRKYFLTNFNRTRIGIKQLQILITTRLLFSLLFSVLAENSFTSVELVLLPPRFGTLSSNPSERLHYRTLHSCQRWIPLAPLPWGRFRSSLQYGGYGGALYYFRKAGKWGHQWASAHCTRHR